ncbi:hypothetical protein HK104_005871 [Borealophlyctis nickersoniae]|nr:hypothetical protein HK104_005871 [Borealophlyctis nickersoniae]
MIEHKVALECIQMSNNLAGRLENVKFGLRNKTALDETTLKEFVQNADTFDWFKARHRKIAESMQEVARLGGGTKLLTDKDTDSNSWQGGMKLLMDKDTDSNSRTYFTNESESESESEAELLDLGLDWDLVVDEAGNIIGGTFPTPLELYRPHTPSDRTVTVPRDKGNQREETNGTGSSSTKRKPSNTDTIPEPSDPTVANTGSSSSGTAAQRSDRTVANTGSSSSGTAAQRSDRTVANTGSSSGTAAQRSDRTVANTGSSTIRGPSDRTVTAPRDKGNQREETNGTAKRKLSNTVTNEKVQKKPKT